MIMSQDGQTEFVICYDYVTGWPDGVHNMLRLCHRMVRRSLYYVIIMSQDGQTEFIICYDYDTGWPDGVWFGTQSLLCLTFSRTAQAPSRGTLKLKHRLIYFR